MQYIRISIAIQKIHVSKYIADIVYDFFFLSYIFYKVFAKEIEILCKSGFRAYIYYRLKYLSNTIK